MLGNGVNTRYLKSMTRAMHSPLKLDVRADLFKQLETMEEAGLPIAQALTVARLRSGAQVRLTNASRYLEQGLGIAEAGLASGLFTPFEASLLHAALSAGRLAPAYRRLSEHCALRAAHAAAMRSLMAVPLVMLVIAIFLQPVPTLVAGTLSLGGYLIKCLFELIALGAAVCLFTDLPHHLQSGSSTIRALPLDGVLPRVPLFGSMYVRRNVRDFFATLAVLLEAGMPILEALPLSVDAIRSPAIKRRFSQIKPRIEGGASFAQAVGELSFVGHEQAHAMILAGETSGALPDVLFGYSAGETTAINQFDDLVAKWTPRVVYTLVALWIGYGILRSGAFMPRVPQDL